MTIALKASDLAALGYAPQAFLALNGRTQQRIASLILEAQGRNDLAMKLSAGNPNYRDFVVESDN